MEVIIGAGQPLTEGFNAVPAEPFAVADAPSPRYFHLAYMAQLPFSLPVDQLTSIMMRCVNYVHELGWEVLLPTQILGSGGPLVQSQKILNVLIWLRCPADSPLVHQPPGPPPEFRHPPPEAPAPRILSEDGQRPGVVN